MNSMKGLDMALSIARSFLNSKKIFYPFVLHNGNVRFIKKQTKDINVIRKYKGLYVYKKDSEIVIKGPNFISYYEINA